MDQQRPRYEQEAEQLARSLKLAKWERLAAQINAEAERAATTPNKSFGRALAQLNSEIGFGSFGNKLSKLQVTLCWQDDGRFVTIHDRARNFAVAFQWTADEMILMGEVHPERLNMFAQRSGRENFERPLLPLDEGIIGTKIAQKAGQMDEFRKAVQWRYATKLGHTLDALLLEACDRMRDIDGDIGIAYAGHRFNDAAGDDNWLAIRWENFAWENGSYFQRSAESLRSAPPEIHSLLGLLVHLQSSGLSSAYNACYGYPVDALDVIGLFRQDGRFYFACSNSHESCAPVYEVDVTTGRSTLCGFSDRYDWNFNKGKRAGGLLPKDKILEIVSLEEIDRRIETGNISYDGPPHDMKVPWTSYLPFDPTV